MVAVVNDFNSYYFSYQYFVVVFCCLLLVCRTGCFLVVAFLFRFFSFCNWFLFIDLACSGYTLSHTRTRTQTQPGAECDQIR